MIHEEWKTISGYEELYMISNNGRVFSKIKNRVKKNSTSVSGYHQIMLFNNKKWKNFYVHRLVAEHFVDGDKSLKVDHIDRDKKNNIHSNLRFITNRENIIRGKRSKLNKNKSSKFTGVTFRESSKKWRSLVRNKGKSFELILSNSESECANVYLQAVEAIKNDCFEDFLSDLREAKRYGVFRQTTN